LALIRTLVTISYSPWPTRDYITNTVFHNIGDGGVLPAIDYDNHAQEVGTLFHGFDPTYSHTLVGLRSAKVEARVYDMRDAHEPGAPRPEKGYWSSAASGSQQLVAHQIGCVLSFYAGRNIKRKRGHIYLGPFGNTEGNNEMVGSSIQGDVLTLGHGLFDIGGENVAHVVWSRMDLPDSPAGIAGDSAHVVSDYWVDNSWDIVRRRKQKATNRLTLHP
jgi:hypothetical protein